MAEPPTQLARASAHGSTLQAAWNPAHAGFRAPVQFGAVPSCPASCALCLHRAHARRHHHPNLARKVDVIYALSQAWCNSNDEGRLFLGCVHDSLPCCLHGWRPCSSHVCWHGAAATTRAGLGVSVLGICAYIVLLLAWLASMQQPCASGIPQPSTATTACAGMCVWAAVYAASPGCGCCAMLHCVGVAQPSSTQPVHTARPLCRSLAQPCCPTCFWLGYGLIVHPFDNCPGPGPGPTLHMQLAWLWPHC